MTSSVLANQKLKKKKSKGGSIGAVHLFIPVLKWDKHFSQRCEKSSEKTAVLAVFIPFTHKEEKGHLSQKKILSSYTFHFVQLCRSFITI